MQKKSIALYPGSFDPITNGHLNIIERGTKIFDKLIVGIANNIRKKPLFSPAERAAMIQEAVGDSANVEVAIFDTLLADYAQRRGVTVLLRGLRAISDFEMEFQMAHMNRRLAPDIETVFMMTGEDHFYVSSQLVREIASFGGDISGLVPNEVAKRLQSLFGKQKI